VRRGREHGSASGLALLRIPVVVALPILVVTEADVGIALPPVRGDPGVLVRWGWPVVRLLAHIAMTLAFGAAALALIVGPAYRSALVLAARAAAVSAPLLCS